MATLTTECDEIKRFSRLYKGFEGAFGVYQIEGGGDGGKVQGKAKTIPNGPTAENFAGHLNGTTGIGIIPLLRNEKCWFGAIDIDIKGAVKLREDHFILEARIRELNLPVVMCRSKSDGVHLYLFASEAVSSRLVQSRLIEFAAVLGYGGCEVFPKQVMRIKETDYGNWINLPYFGDTRRAIHDGVELNLNQFMDAAESMFISSNDLRSFKVPLSDEFSDGPPCLQQLSTIGFTEGGRNTCMLNVGVYFKKKYADDWQEKAQEFNTINMQPPLDSSEVSGLGKSLSKKGYNYTCKQSPIAEHCNRPQCLKREYGVASGEEGENVKLPITGITRFIAGDSYRWGVNTSEAMLEFSTEELLSLEAHRKKFTELLGKVMPEVKYPNFLKQMQELVNNCETVYDPEDASETGQMMNAVESWFLNKTSAANMDEMIKGKWWRDPDNSKIYFIGDDLEKYLRDDRRMKQIQPHKLWRLIKKKYDADQDRLMIKGKRRRVWMIPHFEPEDDAPLEVRTVEKKEERM